MNPGTSRAAAGSGFVRADSSNLPHMDQWMILEYIGHSDKHNIAEIRGAKMLASSRESYLESAVGYVELERSSDGICTLRAKITPEHKVTSKNYSVTVILNERTNIIQDATCEGCAAAAGGCKHSLLFLYWLSKKSGEPAPTSVQCYWKKPKLSATIHEPLAAEDIFKNSKKIKLLPKNSNILEKFIEQNKKHENAKSLISLYTNDIKTSYNLFDMTLQYSQANANYDFYKYKSDLDAKITPDVVQLINSSTVLQVQSKLWHSIRQGRITASKIYEASQCNTDGSLVQHILGGYKVPETIAIKRGQKLEKSVITEVEKIIQKNVSNSGFILINSLIGASPDGVGDDFIVEVKCPFAESTIENYVSNNKIKEKFAAQMQIQMLAANKSKGLFCIADPGFENNKKVFLYWLDYDPVYTNNLIERATRFWRVFIYDKLIKSVK